MPNDFIYDRIPVFSLSATPIGYLEVQRAQQTLQPVYVQRLLYIFNEYQYSISTDLISNS